MSRTSGVVHVWLSRILGLLMVVGGLIASLPALARIEEAWRQGATGAPAKAVLVGSGLVAAAILVGLGAVTIVLARRDSRARSVDEE